MPELRFDTLRKEWVAYATERNDRTFLPTEFCPLCPTGHGGASEVPLDSFEVVVPDLPFEDSVPQNFMRWRWDLDFFNEGVVPIQRYGQYQVQAALG